MTIFTCIGGPFDGYEMVGEPIANQVPTFSAPCFHAIGSHWYEANADWDCEIDGLDPQINLYYRGVKTPV